jgi:streptogramin lyase
MPQLLRFILFTLFTMHPVCRAQGDTPLLRQLTVANGLPQGYVSAIVQDSYGFMWLGTLDGLARYDGREFKAYYNNPDNDQSLSSSIIYHLWMDRKDRLWILYQSGHIDVIDTRTEEITHLTAKADFSGLTGKLRAGNNFVEDHTGQYWMLTIQGDVYMVNKNLTRLTLIPQKDAPMGIAAYDKNIVLSTNNALTYLDSSGTITQTVTIPFPGETELEKHRPERDNSVLKRQNGDLVLIGYERITILNPKKNEFKLLPLPIHKNGYFQWSPRVMDNQGNIYFEHDGFGIWKLDTANNLELYERSETANKSLFIDRSGVLWAGTTGWGIKQFDLRVNHPQSVPYKKDFLSDILNLWGWNIKGTKEVFTDPINSYYWRWCRSKDNKLYIAHSAIFNPVTDIVSIDTNGKPDTAQWTLKGINGKVTPVSAFVEDGMGQLWAVGHDMNLYTLDTAKHIITYRFHIPFNGGDPFSDEVNGLTVDGNDFWIGSMKALVHYNSTSGKTDSYLAKMRVLSICNDPADTNILWVGTTYGGLVKFNKKTGKYRSFKIQDGLPNNTVYAILHDDIGNLWGSTNNSIFSINMATLEIRKHSIQGRLGLIEFNRHHYFKFRNGKLAFGGSDAFLVFDPKEVLTDNYMPKTLISSISVNNSKVRSSAMKSLFGGDINDIDRIELPYNKNFLSFSFSATEYNMPEKLQFRYMLKGLDKGWIYTGNDNTATYTTIPPGKYELLINASNTTGAWSSSIKKITVIITPPFWETWWFITGVIISILLIVYFLVQRKIAITRKRDQQQLSFEREAMQLEARALRSQMNPHFIFNCLNSIKSLIHTDRKKEAVLYLTTFAELLRNQLKSNLLEITLAEELETCELYLELEALRFGNKLKYEFSIDPSLDCRSVKIPALLLQPFIENAIIHGLLPLPDGGKITVSVTVENEKIVCRIDDNGAGRSSQVKAESHDSKGIKLIKGRLGLFSAINHTDTGIQIIDKFDHNNTPAGTQVIITLSL